MTRDDDTTGRGTAGPRGARPGRTRRDLPAGPAPTVGSLREAALNHLARFSSTEANLVRVLQRRVARWAQRANRESQPAELVAAAMARARAEAAAVARALVSTGTVDDAAFAAARARRLARGGRSRRAVAAHLATKGVDPETAARTLEGLEGTAADEVTSALLHLRRRRQGPFARELLPGGETAEAARNRALGALARVGFPRDVAEKALDTDAAEAEARILDARRD